MRTTVRSALLATAFAAAIAGGLPDMIDTASDAELKRSLTDHLGESRTHIDRLEKVFKMHGVEVKSVNCPAIDGILEVLEEAEEIGGDIADNDVLDAAIIGSAQAVEHYEITRYGTLAAWARELGREDCAAVLDQTLEEEKQADLKLSKPSRREQRVA